MQATLLAVSIAIILALVAALIGPLYVDWSRYRAVFEAEASRVVGMPVRVTGAIDARILPTPSVVLRGVEVGAAGVEPGLRARELGIEFALGPLLRGEWRAVEMRLVGPQLKVGLDPAGRIDWPSVRVGLDPEQFSIERLAVEDGRAVLTDARNGGRLVLDKLWFNGEVRSLVGPVKGEGGFFGADGERTTFRIAAGRLSEDGAVKLKLALDPPLQALTVEADGALRFEPGAPSFEGTLALARPAGIALSGGRGIVAVPWRASGRVKAGPANALFEQIEFQYGPDERAIKLTGVADVKFGRSPRLDGILSAREIDLDSAFDLPEPARRLPLAAIKAVAEAIGGAVRLPMPVQLGIGIENVTIAGAVVQAVRGDVRTDADGWDLETFEFRAPGLTQARLSGHVGFAAQGVTFKGPATIETGDPRALVAWLEGGFELPRDQIGLLRASGEVALGADRVAIDRLRAEVDRKAVEGRLLYAWTADGRPARFVAELKADEIDLDRGFAFARAALAGAALDPPGETALALALEIGRAKVGGLEARNADVKLRLDTNGLLIERFAVRDLGGAAVALSGRVEKPLTAPTGKLTLDLDARSLEGPLTLLAKLAPDAAAAMRRLAPRLLPIKTRVTLSLAERNASRPSQLAIEGTAGNVRVRLAVEASGDPLALPALEVRADGELSADDGGVLVQFLGLDRAIAVDRRPGRLSFAARGAPGGELRVDARLGAGGLAAAANGTVRLLGEDAVTAALDLSVATADAGPLRRVAAGRPEQKLPVTLRTRLTVARDTVTLADLSGTIAGTPVRGRVELAPGAPVRVGGRLEADAIDAAALIAVAIGVPASTGAPADQAAPSPEPFAPGLFDGASGRIEFNVARAALTPALVARPLKGTVRMGDAEIALEDVEGEVAGGRLTGQIAFRRTAAGVAARGRVMLAEVDAAAVIPSGARPPVTGRLALTVEGDGTGLSPATLMGALSGSGTVTLTDGQIAGFDPKAFDVVIRAADQGLPVDAGRVRDIVAPALERGSLGVPRADGVFTVAAGQVRFSNLALHGAGADLSLSGSIDLAERLIDARLTLAGPAAADMSGAGRPDLRLVLRGPIAAPKRTIEVATLAAWLTLRSVERQTRRIDAIEAEAREHLGPAGSPAARGAPGLPEDMPARPPVDIPPAAQGRPMLDPLFGLQ